jgi:putative phage-type endonuclease
MRVEISQQTPEWHAWRAGGIGASAAAIVMGVHPYQSPYEYWLERTCRVPPPPLNEAMLHGIEHENEARANYAAKTGFGMVPACYQHDEHDFMRASLDGLSYDEKHVVDFKCPQLHNLLNIKKTMTCPEYWILQLHFQMLCCDGETAECSVYNSWDKTSIEFDACRDPAIDKELIKASSYMWDCIQNDTPPERNESDLQMISSKYDEEYMELCQTEDAIKKRKAEIKEILVRNAGGVPSRTQLFTVKPQSSERVDWKKYAEELDPEGIHKPDFVKRLDTWTVRGLKRR